MPRSSKKQSRASSSSAGGDDSSDGEERKTKNKSSTTSIRYEQVFPATKIKAQLYQQIDMPTIAQGPLEVVNVASVFFVQQLLALCDVPPAGTSLLTSDHLRQAVLTAAASNQNSKKTGQTRKRKANSSKMSKDDDVVDFGFLEPVLDESFPEESTTAKVKAYVPPPKRTKTATTTSTKSKKKRQVQEALSSVTTAGPEATIPKSMGDIQPDEEDYD